MDVKIRKATRLDARGISECHLKSWNETYEDMFDSSYLTLVDLEKEWIDKITSGRINVFLAVSANEIVGFISFGAQLFKEIPADSRIYEVYILKSFQDCKLGTKLWNVTIEELKANNFSSCSYVYLIRIKRLYPSMRLLAVDSMIIMVRLFR